MPASSTLRSSEAIHANYPPLHLNGLQYSTTLKEDRSPYLVLCDPIIFKDTREAHRIFPRETSNSWS